MESERKFQVTIPRESLRAALGSVRLPERAEADWCIACGASRAAAALRPVAAQQEMVGKLLEPAQLTSFVKSMQEMGQLMWCIACGAGKGASPLEKLGDPAEVPDAVIDDLANKLINAVRIA